MNDMNISHICLKGIRKLYRRINGIQPTLPKEFCPIRAAEILNRVLKSNQPVMIARFGSLEISTVVNYLSVTSKNHSPWNFIRDLEAQWWWDRENISRMQSNAGFFPLTEENLCKFAELMLKDMELVDVLGSWCHEEIFIKDRIKKAEKVRLLLLEPYWTDNPWSNVLENKKVLVVHPFAEDIRRQYDNNREYLFKDSRVLPKFESLRVVKAVQSIGGGENLKFANWFEALDYMKEQMDKEPYDYALIGCGAYGFPLAAHAKRTGHKAIHLGGALQLLFGIKGARWNKDYNKDYDYSTLPNEYWISPSKSTQNKFTANVEGGCYW